VGVSKATDEEKQNAINSITFDQEAASFDGLVEGMVFSTDGKIWTEYDPSAPGLVVPEEGSSVYIKYPETDTHYETTYIKFTRNLNEN
jgi:hypothetical protein